jgi:hypothetical protein
MRWSCVLFHMLNFVHALVLHTPRLWRNWFICSRQHKTSREDLLKLQNGDFEFIYFLLYFRAYRMATGTNPTGTNPLGFAIPHPCPRKLFRPIKKPIPTTGIKFFQTQTQTRRVNGRPRVIRDEDIPLRIGCTLAIIETCQ